MLANASPVAVGWLAITSLGLLPNLLLLWLAARQFREVRRLDQNGPRRIVTHTKLGVHALLSGMQLLAVVIGLISLTSPSVGESLTTGPALLWGLLVYAATPSMLAVWWHRRQGLLLAYVAREDRARRESAAQHAEMMGELLHNTAVTE